MRSAHPLLAMLTGCLLTLDSTLRVNVLDNGLRDGEKGMGSRYIAANCGGKGECQSLEHHDIHLMNGRYSDLPSEITCRNVKFGR